MLIFVSIFGPERRRAMQTSPMKRKADAELTAVAKGAKMTELDREESAVSVIPGYSTMPLEATKTPLLGKMKYCPSMLSFHDTVSTVSPEETGSSEDDYDAEMERPLGVIAKRLRNVYSMVLERSLTLPEAERQEKLEALRHFHVR